MPRPMGWFRSNGGKIAWLAFFALACQFVFTFDHVHFANVSVVTAALVTSTDVADSSAGGPTSPAQQTPTRPPQDFCAVCNAISLASALNLPAVPPIIPPVALIEDLQWSLAAIEFASRGHFHFSARGPPHA
jgi:hypothetical protein